MSSKIRFSENPDYVYFIEDVVVKELSPTRVVEYYANLPANNFHFEEKAPFIHEESITRRRCDVYDFRRLHRDRKEYLYIAISHEIQDILGMPFEALNQRAQQAESEAHKLLSEIGEFRRITFIGRLIYAFTNDIKSARRWNRWRIATKTRINGWLKKPISSPK